MLPESSRIANRSRNGRAQIITLRAALQVISSSRAITRGVPGAWFPNRVSACSVTMRSDSHHTRDPATATALVRRASATQNHAVLQRDCSVVCACVHRAHVWTMTRSVTLIDTVAIMDARGGSPYLGRDRPLAEGTIPTPTGLRAMSTPSCDRDMILPSRMKGRATRIRQACPSGNTPVQASCVSRVRRWSCNSFFSSSRPRRPSGGTRRHHMKRSLIFSTRLYSGPMTLGGGCF